MEQIVAFHRQPSAYRVARGTRMKNADLVNLPMHDEGPVIVIWEATRACALACRHCRAEAIPHRDTRELSTVEAFRLVDQVVASGARVFIITGGDPLMRPDLLEIVTYSRDQGLAAALSPSATGKLRSEVLVGLAKAGCRRISLSLDSHDAALHDSFRGVQGSFERTIRGIRAAQDAGLTVQINTSVSKFNIDDVERIAERVALEKAVLWSVFLIVPVGRATTSMLLSAEQCEDLFARLQAVGERLHLAIKTTEGPHYRRFLVQHGASAAELGTIGDGKGFVFISHTGEIFPSGFLEHSCGNVRNASLRYVYQNNPFMQRLRQPWTFSGKCGVCEYNRLCGGSRARAFTMTGDAFASEPSCSYVPNAYLSGVAQR